MENIPDLEVLKNLDKNSPGMIYLFCLYPDGRVVLPYTSQGVKDLFGLTSEDVKIDGSLLFNKVHPLDLQGLHASIQESAQSLKDWKYEYRVITAEGQERWLLGNSRPKMREDGSILWTGFTTDISLDKKNEFEFLKTTRLFAVTAKINEMILYSKSRQEVFQEACRIATEEGEFNFAWVGLVDPQTSEMVPVAQSGLVSLYKIEELNILTHGDAVKKNGFMGDVLREGKTIINNSLLGSPELGSSITIPIRFMTKVIGALNLYSSMANFFTRPEIELLEKIVSSISYAIDSIDANEKRVLAEKNLMSALAIRDEFLSIASHELKTPLTSMKLQLQMLQRGMNFQKDNSIHELKINKSLNLSINQVQRMNSLVESLLDVSRIQAGKLDFHFEHFDVSEVLENSLDSFNILISEAGCEVSKSIEKPLICFLDRGRIEQVFFNLISNALKYARGCRVNISLTKEIDGLIFKIQDDGPGVPLDKQTEVFERFQRGSASTSFGGLGLGLFITKQIVDSHGGEIKLESGLGLGASFIVRLPFNRG